MDHIDECLMTDTCNPRFNCAICASLGVVRKTLNRYYTLTYMSEVCQITMGMLAPPSLLFSAYILTNFFAPHIVLHPRHKLTYFKNAQWEEERMDTASEIVQVEYNCKYASLLAEDLQPLSQDSQVMNSVKLVCTLLMLIDCLELTTPSIRGYLTAFPPSLL